MPNTPLVELTHEQINEIAEMAAEKALEKVYTSIGKSVVSRFLWVVGGLALALSAWLAGNGHWPK